MVSSTHSPSSRVKIGEPVWDIARIFPDQGAWSERDYLAFETNRLVEFTDGCVEFLPMPKSSHQRIALLLCNLLNALGLGEALPAPLRMRVRGGKFREPDVLFMLREHADRAGEAYWDGADLVIEVVSEDDPDRDRIEKPVDYAEGRIPEYWIVDPRDESITVLVLDGDRYREHGRFVTGDQATSTLLPQFTVEVKAVFDAGRAKFK